MRRICHLGVGRFHRAHQAVYLNDLLDAGRAEDWTLCGIGLRAADQPVLRALQSNGHRYSVWEAEGGSQRETRVRAITATIDASSDWTAAIAAMSDEATRIISLTITESGYLEQPRSATELVTTALAARRDAGRGGVTLMSCDNLIENGKRLEAAVLTLAQRKDAALARWIESHVTFPCSMVDRITPAGEDPLSVVCEPWRQWIIEDRFAAGRPAFEEVGVVFSGEVKAYEDLKVSLLNGGHSAIAHLGLLLGHVRVDEAMADPLVRGFLQRYLAEVAAVVHAPASVDVEAYQAALIRRFSNSAIEDRLSRLAQDTAPKFQQALLPPLSARLARHLDVSCMTAAVAFWIVNEKPAANALALPERARRDTDAHVRWIAATSVKDYVASLLG